MKTISFAGSFDPMTNGHLWIIKEAMKICDNVKVIVADNPSKKYMFNSFERKETIEQIIKDENISSVSVDIVKDDYVASYLTENDITHIIRGIRNSVDFDQEKLIQRVNSEILGNIQTLFVMAPSDLESVSSSFVKGLIGPENWCYFIKKFLPKASHISVMKKYITNTYFSDLVWSEKYNKVINVYCGDDRYYHNLAHIIDMLDCMANRAIVDYPSKTTYHILKYAILYHDVIYKNTPNLNDFGIDSVNKLSDEEASALVFKESNMTFSNTDKIVDCIKATEHMNKIPTDYTQEIMKNIDLIILGKPWEIYKEYTKNIRKEYSEYSDEEYKNGRINVLNNLLEQVKNNKAFSIPYFIDRYKKKAINNIEQEINELKG